jgi:hypothetical protein
VAGVASGDANAALVAVGRGVGEGVALTAATAKGLVSAPGRAVFADANAGAICVTGIARASGRGMQALSTETDAQTMQHIRVPVAVLRDVV